MAIHATRPMTKKIKERKTSEIDEELKKILETKKANIKVVGAGGAGNNTISRLMEVGIIGAEAIAVNTDAQDLLYSDADVKLLIGKEITGGLGAGGDPKIGMESAKESKDDIKRVLEGSDLVFITCGLGGGTGTGSSPIIAETAKKLGALTIAIVTLPFTMEGQQRMRNAKEGLENLRKVVDTIIVIPNDKLLEVVPEVSIVTAFRVADEILVNSVKGITELITKPGLINLDLADVRAVMQNGGLAMIGMGESDTENRAMEAVEKALTNPLLSLNIDDATGALVNVTGGPDITIKEAQEIVEGVAKRLAPDARIIWGAQIYKDLEKTMNFLFNFNLSAYHISPTIIDGNALDNIKEIVPRFSEIAPFIKKVIELGRSRKKTVFIYSLLPCVIPGYENYIVDLIREESYDTILSGKKFMSSIWNNKFKHRMKKGSCKNCKFYTICPGPWKRYVKFFGFSEFKPNTLHICLHSNAFNNVYIPSSQHATQNASNRLDGLQSIRNFLGSSNIHIPFTQQLLRTLPSSSLKLHKRFY